MRSSWFTGTRPPTNRRRKTIEHNGIGFSRPDAEILSSFAQQYQRRGALSPRQMNLLRRKMPSYASQVARAADTTRLMAALCVLWIRRLRIALNPSPPDHETPHPLPQ